jgi:hypothetical protein
MATSGQNYGTPDEGAFRKIALVLLLASSIPLVTRADDQFQHQEE